MWPACSLVARIFIITLLPITPYVRHVVAWQHAGTQLCDAHPSIALLFLLTTHPPPESAWQPWLHASRHMMAPQTPCAHDALGPFRVHTHSSPNLKPELGLPGSVFDGSEIPTRIPTAWGHHNCTVAFQNLLKHALQVADCFDANCHVLIHTHSLTTRACLCSCLIQTSPCTPHG